MAATDRAAASYGGPVPPVLQRLSPEDRDAFAALWKAAIDERRTQLGLTPTEPVGSAIDRPGAFGVGVFDGDDLVSAAVAMPGRSDDGRGRHNVPGLAHISSVATAPGRWGEGLARQSLRAIVSIARRHGYARVQLWTHRDNERALRLYASEGLVRSGREKADDFGDPIVHLVGEVPALAPTYRPAARVLCLDEHDRVLLMRWWDPTDGYVLYEPPGGGIEAGEEPTEAALREWAEETGLPTPEIVAGPTHVARDAFWSGGRAVTDEWFLLGRLPAGAVGSSADAARAALTDKEKVELLSRDWVGLDDLDSLPDPVTPELGPILDRLRPASR
jgi:8-oxo-dGTP pyrophosphatase MutT (NUDIX family)/GNAT superfamily N-acetyltransferase